MDRQTDRQNSAKLSLGDDGDEKIRLSIEAEGTAISQSARDIPKEGADTRRERIIYSRER